MFIINIIIANRKPKGIHNMKMLKEGQICCIKEILFIHNSFFSQPTHSSFVSRGHYAYDPFPLPPY